MKFVALTTSALGAALLSTQVAADGAEEVKCLYKHPAVINAIAKFCGPKTDMVIPSSYAYNGARSDYPQYPRKAWVSIQGGCSPKQWVPQHYCYSQFYHICAIGDKSGQGVGYYGRNACQKWIIVNEYNN